MTVHVNYSVYIFLQFLIFLLNSVVQHIGGYVYMLVYNMLTFSPFVSMFLACHCGA